MQLKNRALTLFFCLSIFTLSAQNPYGLKPINSLPSAANLGELVLRDSIFERAAKDPTYLEATEEELLWECMMEAKKLNQILNSGTIYTDWDELNGYLSKLKSKIIPQKLLKQVNFYALASADFSVESNLLGDVFISVQAFADVEDESGLAALILMEVAKFELGQHLRKLKISATGNFDKERRVAAKRSLRKLQKNWTASADSLALARLAAAGLSTDGMFKAIKHYIVEEEHQDASTTQILKKIQAARIDQLIENAKGVSNKNGKDFIVSETQFLNLRKTCKTEAVKAALNQHQHDLAMELGFKYHVLDKQNKALAYLLAESIRRSCYLAPAKWDMMFITPNFYRTSYPKSGPVKIRLDKDLFSYMPEVIFRLTDEEKKQFTTDAYWIKSKEFTTNKEAFGYFSALAQKLGDVESILTQALVDVEGRDVLLKRYIGESQAQDKTFAQALLDATLFSSLNDSKLSVLNQRSVAVVLEEGKLIEVNNLEYAHLLRDYAKAGVEAAGRRSFIESAELKKTKTAETNLLASLEALMMKTKGKVAKDFSLAVYNPSYWNYMMDKQVNEIELLNLRYVDSRPMTIEAEKIRTTAESSYAYYFAQSGKPREASLQVSAFRIHPKKTAFTGFVGGPETLNFKRAAAQLLPPFFATTLRNKDIQNKEVKPKTVKQK